MAIALASITLPDQLVWTDEFEWSGVGQAQTRTVAGALLLEESALTAGRPITLADDWARRSVVTALQALAATPAQTHTLTLHGTDYTVAFRRPPIVAVPVVNYAEPDSADWYRLTVNLITVA